ncbi:MAG: HesA/MoeB/ThiF family protein [Desulfuromonadales bacterium]|nr:HesA/MoeB/ThiF family protein [Desulfuromonadales bacterium]
MDELKDFLEKNADKDLISSTCLEEARTLFSLSHAEVERRALQSSLLPARYQRNRNSISVKQQLKLFSSRVAVVGCGGLGGYIIEELARLGVGNLVIIDPDVFEEHNMNRQLFSSPKSLGLAKVAVAARRIGEVNPAVSVESVKTRLSGVNGTELFAGVDVVVDATDNITARLEMATICRGLSIPLVHGAIAGWYGHVCTIFPEDMTLEKIYHNWQDGSGIEQDLGNPSFTPALVASIEVAETCKILLNQKGLLKNRKLTIDLLDMEIEHIYL